MKIEEQDRVLENNKKNMIVSASAGSGKTHVLIEYICRLVCKKKVPIKKLLILTFTKAAATEMKERLIKSLKEEKVDDFILKQIDDLSVSNISTIHSFCEYCLKKYANVLKINENFDIADENLAKKIKLSSLKRAIKNFQENYVDEMTYINFAFKYNEKKLNDAIFDIENMAYAVADKEKFLDKILNSQDEIYSEAEKVVCEFIDNELKNYLKAFSEHHFEIFELQEKFEKICELDSLMQKILYIQNFSMPKFPKKSEISVEEWLFLDEFKEDFKKLKEKLSELNLNSEKIEIEKQGSLEKALTKLFIEYQKEYKKQKENLNVLDFNDLEQYMLRLSTEKVFNEGFSYVFIDEYQDTNSLQEKIIKKVAENCNFVAVGDAKQGIYGFRLASSKIFLKDVEDFGNDENSNALFLKYNFRSDKKILDFVNQIFKDTMTQENANLDYYPNSMLQNAFEFEDDGEKSVKVDLVLSKEKKEKDFDVYSVKEDELEDGTNITELETIRARIEEILKTKIYDNKLGAMRPVSYGDIAIISRSRNSFFNDVGKYLLKSGVPVTTNSKKSLMDTPEIQVLLALLKISLSIRDNISLLAVLMSNFGRFDQNEIAKICLDNERELFEIVSENGKFKPFISILEKFKNDGLTYGYRRAFEILFDETNYYSYIFSQFDGNELYSSINLFLSEIEKSKFDFDLPNLISYFENVEIEDTGVEIGEQNSVLLTTIHKTKGLEYPIVILINAGKSLKRADRKGDIRVDEELGVVTKFYDGDREENTVKMLAVDLKNDKKRLMEEMMIFYVALTRAKNRIYVIGESKLKNLKPLSVSKFDCYFDYVFNTLSNNEIETFLDAGHLEKDTIEFNVISEVENLQIEKNEKKYGKINEKIVKNVQNYLNFKYLYDNNENISFKNSVTNLTKKYEDNNVFQPNYEYINTNSSLVEIGNAYHLALKVIDFNKINSLEDVKKELENELFDEVRNLVDINLLYKNILTLKPFNKKVFKEQEFIMKDTISNLINKDSLDKIMVQGIVDFFAVDDDGKIILIDYKYSGERNSQVLINRYKLQLKLYKNAIESGLDKEVKEIYLLNLRYNNLIKLENI